MKKDKVLSDKEILEKSLKEPWYFGILVDRYQKQFLRKSQSIIHSKEEAEDIVQDTFLRIYKYGKKFKEKDGASFKSWAYAILRNNCHSYYVKNKKYTNLITSVDFSKHDFEDTKMTNNKTEKTEMERRVESILSLMPQSFQNILRLYFLEEKSQKEIALIENISYGTVRTRIHRAKNFFKELNIQTI